MDFKLNRILLVCVWVQWGVLAAVARADAPTSRPALPELPHAMATQADVAPLMTADANDPAWQMPAAITGLTLPLRTKEMIACSWRSS